jgi:scyllo-inositol 2-dehydrogenase (NADP+)
MNEGPITTAILSYGMSGEVFHAPLLSALSQFRIHSIVQRNGDKARQHYPSVKLLRSVDEALLDPDIELIIVNTPNETHFEFTSRALDAGKHVVVEKPFTVTSKEAEQLIEKAGKLKKVLTVFQNRRWDSVFLTVRKVLDENLLGKVVEVEAHYDRFRNYVEQNTWKEVRTEGTGILYNLGSHVLDQMVVLFGMPRFADARIGIQRPGGKVDDFYDIRLEYDDKLVIVKSSYLVKEAGPRYILHGVNGSFVKYGDDVQEQDLKERKDPNSLTWGTEPEDQWGKLNIVQNGSSMERRVPSERGNYLNFYRNLHEAIRTGGELAVKPQQALSIIRLIEACYESSKNKCAIRIESGKG